MAAIEAVFCSLGQVFEQTSGFRRRRVRSALGRASGTRVMATGLGV